jgi:hypothetical protein
MTIGAGLPVDGSISPPASALLPHALGGALHTPDTIANLQSKVTDAVLATIADLIAHIGNPSAHHVRYSDAEAAAVAAALIAIHAALSAAGVHGSSVAAAINTLIHRDAAGRAQITNPSVDADIDNKGSRDAAIEAHRAGAVHTLPQPPQAHAPSHEPGGSDPMAVNAVAGTGSLRTLAGSGVALSAAHSDHTHTLQSDNSDSQVLAGAGGVAGTYSRVSYTIGGSATVVFVSFNLICAASSMAFGVAACAAQASALNSLKVQLVMDGILIAESGYISSFYASTTLATGWRSWSGSGVCQCRIKNYNTSSRDLYWYDVGYFGITQRAVTLAVGSVKI